MTAIPRLHRRALLGGLVSVGVVGDARAAAVGEDGLYRAAWFLESFLDLADDLAAASEAGKRLVVAWELRGCPACKATHEVTLADPQVVAYLTRHFEFVQLDIIGARPVTFPDGDRRPEKAQARRLGVTGTPTFQVFDASGERGRLEGFHPPAPFLDFFRGHAARA